jgi:tripartite ATP-independent transporter DctM subunit
MSLGKLDLLIFFGVLLPLAVFAGIPIAFSFGLSTLGFVALTTTAPTIVIADRTEDGMSNVILLAIPMFVFLGYLIEANGMARAMLSVIVNALGRVRGGLYYATVAAMYLVSGISGSKAADMAAVAPVLFPEMKRRGAEPGDLVAMLAATGAQTETIAPSLVLITIASVTDVSIDKLFTGGLLPATLLGAILCLVIWFRSPAVSPSESSTLQFGHVLRTFVVALPALVLPFLIRAAVVEGIATATEVSAVGIFYALIVGMIFYDRNWRRIGPILVDTASLSGAIIFILGTANAMGWALTQSGFSVSLAHAVEHLPGGSASFLAASIAAFIFLGSILEGVPAIILFGPLVFPIARSLGIHEVHYAIVIVLAMGIGLHTPPFGVGYYIACAIGGANPSEGVRPVFGYMLALLLGLAAVAAIPALSTGFLN